VNIGNPEGVGKDEDRILIFKEVGEEEPNELWVNNYCGLKFRVRNQKSLIFTACVLAEDGISSLHQVSCDKEDRLKESGR